MGVITKIGTAAGNKVAKLSALTPEQIEKVQLEREKFLLEMPDPTDIVARSQTERMMAACSVEIFNAFIPQIKSLYLPIKQDAVYDTPFDADHNIRYFNITKWVSDRKENTLEKLVNVYAVLSSERCNIALIFNRTKKNTNVYLAVVNTDNADNNVNADIYKSRLIEAIRGNFPGAEWKNEGAGILPCFDEHRTYSVASATNIPTEKSEKFSSQTIEKLLDGIIPDSKKKEYTIVLLATPINDAENRKLRLGEFYSGMVPYASWQTDYHYSENQSIGSSATVGVNVGASAGVQNGHNYSNMQSDSVSNQMSETKTDTQSETKTSGSSEGQSHSEAHTEGSSVTDTTTQGSSDSLGGGGSVTATAGGGIMPASASSTANVNYNHTWSSSAAKALGKTAADTLTKGITNSISNSVAKTTGTAVANTLGKAVTKAMATTAGVSKSVSLGGNFGANFARSSSITAMIGKNEGITQTFTNFNIKHALELLENQMKRMEQSSALGMWDFAAYVLSEDQNVANNVAHSYLALTLGEDSYMSKSSVNVWNGNVEEEKDTTKEICEYLRTLRHPIFCLSPAIVAIDSEFYEYPAVVTATTSLSGKELAYSLNFPSKPIAGLPILECAEFGRNVVSYDDVFENDEKIELGSIFHMNHVENNKVELSCPSLSAHTLITGSTGSGKSNTVYQILQRAIRKKIKFLVIEPAKGEYKNVFGSLKDVYVYGTNPLLTPLLRINPFSFPNNIHVLEHLDRLVEIFNVCWPMYAAMPAVLKSAIEKSYVNCGWDMMHSVNNYGSNLYPTFEDVADNIKTIIETSEYDAENKGAYKGSLLTRLRSLSNGINGLIFAADEIDSKMLFDQNVIVDLSRVGSSETKSLIMGMLVLKLQEYHLASADSINQELSHLTVLEEAHNILRRTSTEQSSETANLLGKSVEMIANAIAEMRTYGEGFIIADQAPGLLDMSVIRNTNTKIIMRLPDESDRNLVGKAANLNDEQIIELAKLPRGVAAVYQNEWVQPVLCKVNRFQYESKPYKYVPVDSDYPSYAETDHTTESLLECIIGQEVSGIGRKTSIRRLKEAVIRSRLNSKVKKEFLSYLAAGDDNAIVSLRTLIYDFLKAEEAIRISQRCDDIFQWTRMVADHLEPSIKEYSNEQIDLVVAMIIYEQSLRDASYQDILIRFTEEYMEKGRVY